MSFEGDTYTEDDLSVILQRYGKQPKPAYDVSPLLDRMREPEREQESSGGRNARPNPRTGAIGDFQVLPENIPSWTRKHVGRTLTPQQFAADTDAQVKVFNGEMGDYLTKAMKRSGGDEDTAIRMAAAAWYGGEHAMHRFDDPHRFRPNEPSFREYTNSILKRSRKSQPTYSENDLDVILSQRQGYSEDELSSILSKYQPAISPQDTPAASAAVFPQPAGQVAPSSPQTGTPPRILPQQGGMTGTLHLDPRIAPRVPNGAPRPFAPGEWVDNPDGSWSSEISQTVMGDPSFNNGRPTVIPGMWLVNGKPQRVSEDQAIEYAKQSGLSFPSFNSLEEAEKFANDRESVWQGVKPQDAAKIAPLWTRTDPTANLQSAPISPVISNSDRTDEFAPPSPSYTAEQQKYSQIDTVGRQAVEANRLGRVAQAKQRRQQAAQRAQQGVTADDLQKYLGLDVTTFNGLSPENRRKAATTALSWKTAGATPTSSEQRNFRNSLGASAPSITDIRERDNALIQQVMPTPTLADTSQAADRITSQNTQINKIITEETNRQGAGLKPFDERVRTRLQSEGMNLPQDGGTASPAEKVQILHRLKYTPEQIRGFGLNPSLSPPTVHTGGGEQVDTSIGGIYKEIFGQGYEAAKRGGRGVTSVAAGVGGDIADLVYSLSAKVARTVGATSAADQYERLAQVVNSDVIAWDNDTQRQKVLDAAVRSAKGESKNALGTGAEFVIENAPRQAAQIVKLMALGELFGAAGYHPSMTALFGIQSAIDNRNEPVKKQLQEFATSLAMGKVIQATGSFGRVPAGGAFGLLSAGEAYARGERDPQKLAGHTILGAATGAALADPEGIKAREIPERTAGYLVKMDALPEWAKDNLADVAKYGKGVVLSSDGRAVSVYADPNTGEVFGNALTPEQARQYDPSVVTGKARPVRDAKFIDSAEFDRLAQALNIQVPEAQPRLTSGIEPTVAEEKDITPTMPSQSAQGQPEPSEDTQAASVHPQPITEPQQAIWHNAEGDMPVTVTGDLGEQNGKRFVSIAESRTGVPLDEIEMKGDSPDVNSQQDKSDIEFGRYASVSTRPVPSTEAGASVENVRNDASVPAPKPRDLAKASNEEVAQLRQEGINRQREALRRATESPNPKSAAATATIAAAQEHIRAYEAGENDEALRKTVVSRRNASIAQRVLDGENVSAEERTQANDEIERQLNKAEENMAQMAPAAIRNTLRLSPSDWNGLIDEVLAADSPTQVAAIIRSRERGINGLDLPDVEWLHNLWKLNRAGRDIRGILEAARPKGTPKAESATATFAPRTVSHPDPEIDGKPIVAETQDGRVIIPNPSNVSGVSVVKNRRGINVPDLPKNQGQEEAAVNPTSPASRQLPTEVAPVKSQFAEAFGSAKNAVTDSYVRDAYQRMTSGKKLLFSEKPNTLEGKVQKAFDAGQIKSEDDIRPLVTEHFNPPAAQTEAVRPEVSTNRSVEELNKRLDELVLERRQTQGNVTSGKRRLEQSSLPADEAQGLKNVVAENERRLIDIQVEAHRIQGEIKAKSQAVAPAKSESAPEGNAVVPESGKIKAVEKDYPPGRRLPPEYVYHNTTPDAVEAIESEGLSAGAFSDKPIDFNGQPVWIAAKKSDLPNVQSHQYGNAVSHEPSFVSGYDEQSSPIEISIPPEKLYLVDKRGRVIRRLGQPSKQPTERGAEASPLSKQEQVADSNVIPHAEATFDRIKELVGNSLAEHIFEVDNGGKIVARTKVTTRNGLVATEYLHVNVIQPNGDWEKWREQPSGSFKSVDSGNLGSLRNEYRPEAAKAPRSKQERAQQAKPTAAEVKKNAKAEKVDAKTGLKPSQEDYLAGKLENYAERHYLNTDQYPQAESKDEAISLLEHFAKINKSPLYQRAGKKETIKVPDDGEFTVSNVEQANRLHQKITGQPIEGLPKEKGTRIQVGTKQSTSTPDRTKEDYADYLTSAYGDVRVAAKKSRALLSDIQSRPETAEEYGEKAIHDFEVTVNELEARSKSDIRVGDTIEFEDGLGEKVQRKVTKLEMSNRDTLLGYRVDKPYATGKRKGKVTETNFRGSSNDLVRADDGAVEEKAEESSLKMAQRGDQTDTEAFKKWFKDSKVVDEKGEPLVVYHGTPDARDILKEGFLSSIERYRRAMGFDETDPDRAFFFTNDRAVGQSYADPRRAFDYQGAEPQNLEVYLRLQNPLEVNNRGEKFRDVAGIVRRAKAEGHDGIIIRNAVDPYNLPESTRRTQKPMTIYVAFDSTQIKSVNNEGTYDPNNSNILKMANAEASRLRSIQNDTDLISEVRSSVSDNTVIISPHAQELLRRAESEKAASFDGQFLNPNQVKDTIKDLDTAAKTMRVKGYDEKDAKKLDKLRHDLIKAARSGKGTVVITVENPPEAAIPHESFHQGSHLGYAARKVSEKYPDLTDPKKIERKIAEVDAVFEDRHAHIEELADHPAVEAWRRFYSNTPQYMNASRGVVVEETAATIAGGDYAKLGISDDVATDYLTRWFKSYVEKNGKQSVSEFRRQRDETKKIIEATRDRYSRQAGRPVDEGLSGIQDEQSREAEGEHVEVRQESESKGRDEAVDDVAEAKVSGESVNDVRLKNRKFAQTLRRSGRPAEDVSYVPETEAGFIEAAEKILSKGLDKALSRFNEMSQREALKPVLGTLLADRLGAEERFDEQQKVYKTVIEGVGNAALLMRMTQIVSLDDPAHAVEAAGLLKAKSNGEPLSKSEAERAYNVAVEGQQARENQAEVDARIEALEQQKSELEERLKVSEEKKFNAEELKRQNRNLKAQVARLKSDKETKPRAPRLQFKSQRDLMRALEAEESDIIARLSQRFVGTLKMALTSDAKRSTIPSGRLTTKAEDARVQTDEGDSDNRPLPEGESRSAFPINPQDETALIPQLNITIGDVMDRVQSHLEEIYSKGEMDILDMAVVGSYIKGTAKPDSDLDVVVEYVSTEGVREDDIFNYVNNDENALYINHVRVDINPITESKSGDVGEWLARHSAYGKSESPLKMAQTSSPDEDTRNDLIDYATLQLLRNIPKGNYTVDDLRSDLEKFASLPDEEFNQITAEAYSRIKVTPKPLSDEAKQSIKNRREFEKIVRDIELAPEREARQAEKEVLAQSKATERALKHVEMLQAEVDRKIGREKARAERTLEKAQREAERLAERDKKDAERAAKRELLSQPKQGPKLSEGIGRKEGPRLTEAPKYGPRLSEGLKYGPPAPDALARILSDISDDQRAIVAALLYRSAESNTAWSAAMKDAYPDLSQKELRETFTSSKELLDKGKEALKRERVEIRAEKKLTDEEYLEAREEQKDARLKSVQSRQSMANFYKSLTQSRVQKVLNVAQDIAGISRSILTSNDASFGGRQGLIPLITNTRVTAKALWDAKSAYLTEGHYADLVEDARLHPDFKLAQRLGAKFSAIGDNPFEHGSEFFTSRLADYYPGVKRSERLYTLQADLTILNNFSNMKGIIDARTDLDATQRREAYKAATNFLNISVGKGNFGSLFGHGGAIEKVLNVFGFAPRFKASRFQFINYMLNPYKLYKLPRGARRIIVKKVARFNLAFLGLFAGLAALGLTSLDAEDKERYLVIRWGDHRFDVLGGLKEPLRLTVGLGLKATGYALMAAYGKIKGNDELVQYGTDGMARIWGNYWSKDIPMFLRSALSPLASIGVNRLAGEDMAGKPVTAWNEFTSNAWPLIAQSTWDALTYDRKEQLMHDPDTYSSFKDKLSKLMKGEFNKNIKGAVPIFAGEAVGVGTQMYPNKEYSTALKEAQYLTSGEMKEPKDPERARIESGLHTRLLSGEDFASVMKDAKDYEAKGILKPDDIEQLEALKGKDPLAVKAQKMDSEQIKQVMRFATPEQKKTLLPILHDKLLNEAAKEGKDKKDAEKDAAFHRNVEEAAKTDPQGAAQLLEMRGRRKKLQAAQKTRKLEGKYGKEVDRQFTDEELNTILRRNGLGARP